MDHDDAPRVGYLRLPDGTELKITDVVLTVDLGLGSLDHTAMIAAFREASGDLRIVEMSDDFRQLFDVVVSRFDMPDDPGPLTQQLIDLLGEPKAADDTIRASRSGGPPPHTLKNYDRRRSNR